MALSTHPKANHMICSNLFYVVVLQVCAQLVVSQSTVEYLPGFNGPLPFQLETGYVGVDESEDVQLFYYFVKSERNPKVDPLILWLTGGPGCSAFSGLVYEIGPMHFKNMQYNGSLPTLLLNTNAWTKMASIIFLDLPVGSGFSYGRTPHAFESTDLQACDQAYQFMKKWLMDHIEFISNPFYVGGDSYTGLTVPIITQLISNGNEASIEQLINLKGYILGNPITFANEVNYAVPFAHGMGLISDELYESLQRNCKGQYRNIDEHNIPCLQDFEAFVKCCEWLNKEHVLERLCELAAPKPQALLGKKRALGERVIDLRDMKALPSEFYCRADGYKLSYQWMDDKEVRKALHVREGTIRKWKRCNSPLPYKVEIRDSRPYHINISKKGYRSLIYSGDHDMKVPFLSTQAWIRNLKYSIIDDWRPWTVHNQVAGYTRTYSNQMTFATVKDGGHTAPEYKPEECYAMFKRWISHEPL